MKQILLTAVVLLFFAKTINAQITLTGKLYPTAKNTEITLTNFDGIKIPISVNANKEFAYTSDSLLQGFYDLDEVGKIYLTNGYTLKISPTKKKDEYSFNGVGAVENNTLNNINAAITKYIPLDKKNDNIFYSGLAQAAFYIDPTLFLSKIDSLKLYGKDLYHKSTDSFFRNITYLDLSFLCKSYLNAYFLNYGKDFKIMSKAIESLSDVKNKSDVTKYIALKKLAQKKEMSLTDMKKIMGIIYEDWDKTNENLFKNSSNYRKEFDKYIMAVYQDSKYMSMLMSAKNPEDGMIVLLKAATDAVTNPYILNYFNYTYSTNIINATKDTAVATKYYQQFMANNTKQDYAKEITKIYQTKLKYSNGMPTPLFSFNNISGKPVALQSLLGKYVYIDVWATWCTPCKAEIPHLQKLEAIYKTKNIQFLSISVDEQKNAKRWKAYVTKNKLGGLQLMADSAFESNFIKSMGIISIPRFILIDPQGKLVEADALRPSDKQLKTILDKLL